MYITHDALYIFFQILEIFSFILLFRVIHFDYYLHVYRLGWLAASILL